MSKPKTPTKPAKPSPKAAGSDLIALNLRIARDLVEALDEVVEKRKKANPYAPVTRTDVVREALIRTVTEERGAP